jgi:hypothetical protein
MVTPELLEYVRTEISKGKTREKIHTKLISDGGWTESDLSEAFRVVIPMQDIVLSDPIISERTEEKKPIESVILPKTSFSPLEPTPSSKPFSLSSLWHDLVFIIVGLLCIISWYFYRPQIINFWDSSVASSQELSVNSWNSLEQFSVNSWNSLINSLKNIHIPSFSLPSFDLSFLSKSKDTKDAVVNTFVPNNINNAVAPIPVVQPTTQVKDCGTMNTALKFGVSSTYENNSVLSCLGKSAINCENAKGTLTDDFFPTIFEITKLPDSCNFKLSYPSNNTLTDIAGKKLAGQYISCPLNIVKAIDNTNPAAPQLIASDKTDLSKYASQIYFYGTLGLFAENNLDQNKIKNLGCQGEYIQSMIVSYSSAQKK